MKKYLDVTIKTKMGWVDNPLQLHEAYLISRIAQDHPDGEVIVRLDETTKENYKMIFG